MLNINVDLIEVLKHIATEAGEAILNIYNASEMIVNQKEDNSPLTQADIESHTIISKGLLKINGSNDIPIISEESAYGEYDIRKNYSLFWLVDPLDGTKEFINRNGEFTVNIALMQDRFPIFGMIYVPVSREIYYGGVNLGCKKNSYGDEREICVSSVNGSIRVVQSKSHSSEKESEFYSSFEISERTHAGSSLKFCMVAEGKADLYYRNGPTMEWDTAAGQAIVEGAGGIVLSGGKRMSYNKIDLHNSSFIVSSFESEKFYGY